MNHTTSTLFGITLAGLLAILGPSAKAAVVTWGSATNISGDSDVSTAGTLVGAFNTGAAGVANTTVNGVTFSGLTLTGTSLTSGNFKFDNAGGFENTNAFGSGSPPFTNLSLGYQALLSSAAGSAGANGNSPFSLTISGLTIGNTYQFEWWSHESPADALTVATAGSAVTLEANIGGLGQFVIGSFVADANQQLIGFSVGSAASVLNGLELRNVSAVPEPGTWLFGAALSCVGLLARRRNAISY